MCKSNPKFKFAKHEKNIKVYEPIFYTSSQQIKLEITGIKRDFLGWRSTKLNDTIADYADRNYHAK